MQNLLFSGLLIASLTFGVAVSSAEISAQTGNFQPDISLGGDFVRIADDEDVRDEDYSPDESEMEEQASGDPLKPLFAKLKTESRASSAGRIARQIVGVWNESGSDSIDLLMQWASEAMAKKQYVVAQDLLAHVTVLKPGFAEGWNRRATLYFMMSDYGRSLSDIEQTLRLEPRHFGALSGLAAILQKTRKHQRALDTWYKVLDIYPANRQAQKTVIELEEKLAGEGI